MNVNQLGISNPNILLLLFLGPRLIDLSQEYTGEAATLWSLGHHQERSMPLLRRCGRNSIVFLWTVMTMTLSSNEQMSELNPLCSSVGVP